MFRIKHSQGEFVLNMLTCPNFCLSLLFLGSKLSLKVILCRISSATFVSPPFSVSSLVKFFSCFTTTTTFFSVIVAFAISLNYKNKKLIAAHLIGLSKSSLLKHFPSMSYLWCWFLNHIIEFIKTCFKNSLERSSIECHKTKSEPIAYQLDYSFHFKS